MKHVKTGLVNFFQYGISAVETELGKCKTIQIKYFEKLANYDR